MTSRRHGAIAGVAVLLAWGCSSGSPTAPTASPTVQASSVQPSAPALTIGCPPSLGATSPDGAPVAVSFAAATTSGGVAPATVSCTRQPGSMFAVGSTTVLCTAVDAARQSVACLFDVTVTTASAAPPRLGRTKFMAFGDSITLGEVVSPTSTSAARGSGQPPNFAFVIVPSVAYPTRLQSLLRSRYIAQAAAIDVANAGVPGEWAQDGARRLPNVLANARPEVVLLLQGYNDLSAQGDAGVLPAAQAMDRMAKEASGRGARVMIATLTPPRPSGAKALGAKAVTDFNAWIRSIAAGEGAVLVDLNAGLSTDLMRYIDADGLHPTEAGYERMAELFRDAIRSDLEIR